MCRMLAYLGNNILLSRLLLLPEHSLEKQAWQPKELRETKLNADGYGYAWYTESNDNAFVYKQILPIWNDPNLNALSNSMQQPLWMAIVRSATIGLGVSHDNTPPFTHQKWSYMHNGYLLNFDTEFRHKFRNQLEDKYHSLIKGNTDSEYIFALLLQQLDTHSPVEAIKVCMEIISKILKSNRALLNIALSDGERIYATRHAINGESPTLYYCNNSQEFGDDNQIVASEKLNAEDCWTAVDEHEIIVLQKQKPAQTINL